MRALWITGRRFGQDLCQTTQVQVGKALCRRGWKVGFLSPQGEGVERCLSEEGLGFRGGLNISSIKGLKTLSLTRQVRRSLEDVMDEGQQDVVICDWRASLAVKKILADRKIPWIIIDRGPPAVGGLFGLLQRIHYARCWKVAGKAADLGLTVSVAHAAFVKEKFALPILPTVIPAGADPNRFQPAEQDRKSDRPGIDRPLRLVYHGRLDRSRDVEDLVQVADELRQGGTETTLRMFGQGTSWNRLNAMAQELEWFELLPTQSPAEVPDLLKEMDVGLLPMDGRLTWRTASPLKLFEYAACGLAVMATDIAAHHIDQEPDWLGLVPVDQRIDGMVRALQEWVVAEIIPDLARQARTDFAAGHTWDHSIEQAAQSIEALVQVPKDS